ncbi:putative leucine Rich repeat-containing domain protein [Trichinella nativa]|uniref:Putative leucine Rich repeat-containing domain protein n=1 Tax=Trichinella nativa TaxID=6335 RepID=A0A1Y3EGT6_9BILA|nr:putative leucine Rich repeat-containing domain protein [Trichinella nativa]
MNLHEIPQFSENDCQIISILLQGDFNSVSKDQFFMFKDTLKELIISTTSSQPLVIDDMAFNGLAISEIERLEIDAGGKMSEVPSAVQNLQKLNTLIINGTDIKSLNALFAKNTSLHTLRISNSQLMNIDLNAFTYLRFFTTLELPGNKLNQIPRDALVPVQKTLRSLDLSYNEITSVDNGAFVDFERLRQLNLSNNPIALVSNGAFAKSASLLSTLDLSHCQLESIPSGALVGLKLLRYLNVSSNRIAHLSEASFGNMTSLISVDLTNNPIKTVAVDAFYGASFPSVTLSNTELEQLDLAIFGTSTALRELQIFDSPSLRKLYANFSTSGSTSIDVELRNVGTLELDRSLFDWLLKPTFSLKIHPNETVHCDATSVGWLTAVVRCFGVMPLDKNEMQKCVIFVLLDYVISRIVVVLMGKRSMGENCELKGAATFDPFSVCNVIDILPIWVDHLFGFSLLLQASNGQWKFQQQGDIYSKHCPEILLKEAMPSNSVLPLFLVMLVTFHWTLCQCFVLPTFREFQDFFKRASKSVPASDELTNGWKSLLSSMLPKILPEKTADMVRTVVDMVKLVNTSQPTSNEEHFNEAAAVTKSITADETIIRVPARSPSVMEQSLGLLRPFFDNIDPWRAILYRDPPLLSVDLADGDSQENDMTRPTSSLDSFKSNLFKSTNHDSQLLDELETEPVAARRPVDYFNYYYNS